MNDVKLIDLFAMASLIAVRSQMSASNMEAEDDKIRKQMADACYRDAAAMLSVRTKFIT